MSRRRWYASLGSRGGSHAAIPVRINIPVYLMLMSESCIHLHTSIDRPVRRADRYLRHLL